VQLVVLDPLETTPCDSTMKYAVFVVSVVVLGACPRSNAFGLPTTLNSVSATRQQSGTTYNSALHLSPQDLTDMMAKAHEEKIRAMKGIEEKKNAEIQVNRRDESFVMHIPSSRIFVSLLYLSNGMPSVCLMLGSQDRG
jgi:monoamine oxidase